MSAFVAAPYAGLSLGQLGATVIRIDPIEGGLDYKRWPITADGKSLYWAGLNKGKKSIALDMKKPEAIEIAQSLMTIDGPNNGFILTNLKAKGWLDFNNLQKLRKDIVMVNITGTANNNVAVDYTVNARTGFPLVTGPEGYEGAINHVLPVWDIVTGQAAMNALLIADRHRANSGEGQYIKIPLADSAFSTLSHLGYVAEVEINNIERPRTGNHVFGTFAYDFSTKDEKRIMITAFTKNHWHALLRATNSSSYFKDYELTKGIDAKILGPVNAPVYKIKKKFRNRLLIRSKKVSTIQKKLSFILKSFNLSSGIKLTVDVDPINFN